VRPIIKDPVADAWRDPNQTEWNIREGISDLAEKCRASVFILASYGAAAVTLLV
jgi:hypothetical protein